MASESNDSDLRERVEQLEATVEQQQQTIRKMLPGRRGALKAGGLLAGGGLLGALGSERVEAADGTQDTSAGTIGAAGDSNDIYLDQLYDPDGDEILNVDDTGDINAAFGRTWAFDDISVPNFSPDSIDTNSLTTVEAEVTGQTRITAARSANSPSTSATTYQNLYDSESRDDRGEFNENGNAYFNPDKSGDYSLNFGWDIRGGTSVGDTISFRIRDVDGDNILFTVRYAVEFQPEQRIAHIETELSANTNYIIEGTNLDSSFKLNAGGANRAIIKREVGQ